MRRTERIIRAFGPLGEAAEPVFLTQGTNPITPPRQYLVGITLVAHVPDDPVARGFEHRVQRDGQFDDAKARPQMPTRLADTR